MFKAVFFLICALSTLSLTIVGCGRGDSNQIYIEHLGKSLKVEALLFQQLTVSAKVVEEQNSESLALAKESAEQLARWTIALAQVSRDLQEIEVKGKGLAALLSSPSAQEAVVSNSTLLEIIGHLQSLISRKGTVHLKALPGDFEQAQTYVVLSSRAHQRVLGILKNYLPALPGASKDEIGNLEVTVSLLITEHKEGLSKCKDFFRRLAERLDDPLCITAGEQVCSDGIDMDCVKDKLELGIRDLGCSREGKNKDRQVHHWLLSIKQCGIH